MTPPDDVERITDGDRRDQSSTRIRAEIEKTRERLEDTVEALGAQLNPSHLTQRFKDNVREATIGRVQHMANNTRERITETGRGLAETIRENPIPAAMVAAGLGWLMINRREGRNMPSMMDGIPDYVPDESEQGPARTGVRRAADAVSEKAHQLTDRAQEATDRVIHRAQDAKDRMIHQAQSRARSTTRRVENQFEESPIGMGAVALAIGLAVGLSIPATRREAELIGDARDKLVDRTREKIADTTERVERVVEKALPEVQNVVKEAAREVRETARDEGLSA